MTRQPDLPEVKFKALHNDTASVSRQVVEEVIAAFLTVPHAENLTVLMGSRMKEAMTAVSNVSR